jgi:hypothetical protein
MGRTACTEPQCLYKCALYLRSTRLLCPQRQISSRHLNVRNSLWLSNVRIHNCGMIPAFSISDACELHYTKTTITIKSKNNAFPSFDSSLVIGQRLLNKSGHVALKETGEYMTLNESALKSRCWNWGSKTDISGTWMITEHYTRRSVPVVTGGLYSLPHEYYSLLTYDPVFNAHLLPTCRRSLPPTSRLLIKRYNLFTVLACSTTFFHPRISVLCYIHALYIFQNVIFPT